jgi:uncharacterized protein (DUF58 family)
LFKIKNYFSLIIFAFVLALVFAFNSFKTISTNLEAVVSNSEKKELLKKVRKIEIKTRRLSDHIFSGEYHTSFKGRGMTFSEVRQYQYGDDIRAIDWNVTARYNEAHVKVFEEERELTMMLMVDISGSENFGSTRC